MHQNTSASGNRLLVKCVLEALEHRYPVSEVAGLVGLGNLIFDAAGPAAVFEESLSTTQKDAPRNSALPALHLEEAAVSVVQFHRPFEPRWPHTHGLKGTIRDMNGERPGFSDSLPAPAVPYVNTFGRHPRGHMGGPHVSQSSEVPAAPLRSVPRFIRAAPKDSDLVDSTIFLPPGGQSRGSITWNKIQVDSGFRSEGVAVADVNRDGQTDVVVGDLWYEAPNWIKHRVRAVGNFGDGANTYSNAFAVFPGDFNRDDWPDIIVIGFPGQAAMWYENPQGNSRWKPHLLWPSACNESPQYVDLFGDGEKELVMAIQPEGRMVWFEVGPDPTQPWLPHPISAMTRPGNKVPGTSVFSHGLGAGDINGDGRLDVTVTEGWWEQPPVADGQTPWPFHQANMGAASGDMITYDVSGDGLADVVSSSAHDYGLWWHEQVATGGDPLFQTDDLLRPLFSQSHALNAADLNNDGLLDLVTGKRWWAHGVDGDPGSAEAPVLYWFEARPNPSGGIEFKPHSIDQTSGIGTQFVTADMNRDGLLDVVVSNKKGVHVFQQES